MFLIFDRMNGVKSIGADQDDVPRLAVEIFLVNMKLSSPLMDIDDFNVSMPMKEDVRLPIFSNSAGQ